MQTFDTNTHLNQSFDFFPTQEDKGTTEDEMAGWHHQLDGHEFV